MNLIVFFLFGLGSIMNTTYIISHEISIIVGSKLGTAVKEVNLMLPQFLHDCSPGVYIVPPAT